jgi:hypothetical protein
MVERWPHIITLKKPAELVQDDSGYISLGTSVVTELIVNCRVKFGGSGVGNSMLSTPENGDVIMGGYTISLPEITEDFSNGNVEWDGKTFNIIKFHQYQGRCKIWI